MFCALSQNYQHLCEKNNICDMIKGNESNVGNIDFEL